MMLECIHRDNPLLPEIIISIAYLSLATETPLHRWQVASQIMIEKGKGRYVEDLRIIQLCKADQNFILHIIWGHRLIRHALHHKSLDPTQYALPGHTCNNVVLNKSLFLDLSRQTLSPGILTDYDATAAFNRVLAGLSIVTWQRVSLPRTAGNFMFNLLKEMQFNLVTGFSQSADRFNNT